MYESLENIEICSKINEEIKINIRFLHVFDDINGYNVLFITSDDKVFGFGSNCFGCFGLGHNSVVNEPQIIPELCHKNIEQFFIGWSFILGLNSYKQVYGWGNNEQGQLGRESTGKNGQVFKPEIICFPYESVIQLSCGSAHSLALTYEGNLFGWGSNENGQIGTGNIVVKKNSTPVRLAIFHKFSVKTIYCSFNKSFVLSNDGLFYSWGYNDWCSLGHDLGAKKNTIEPNLIINLFDVKNICHSSNNTYFITNDGNLYFCGYFRDENNCETFQKTPKLLKSETKFSSLHSIPYYQKRETIASALSQDSNNYLLNWDIIKKTRKKKRFDFYYKSYQLTYKTIQLKSFDKFAGNDKTDLDYLDPKSNRFDHLFVKLEKLGEGSFGKVYKVRNNSTDRLYAVKCISLKGISNDPAYNVSIQIRLLIR